MRRYEINPAHINAIELIENIEDYFQKYKKVLYNQRNIIRLVNFSGQDYVIKSFKKPNIINRLAYHYLRDSKAKRSFLYSLKIGNELTPDPVAYIENIEGCFLTESYYISLHFDYDHTIHQVLTNKILENRSQILKEFSDFTFELHEQAILHNDYSHGNILIKKSNTDDNYDFKVIDINRMKFQTLGIKSRLENFSRINADDTDMEIIISNYAKKVNLPPGKLLENAKNYRDDFYRKRARIHKLRGKQSTD